MVVISRHWRRASFEEGEEEGRGTAPAHTVRPSCTCLYGR